MDNEAYQILPKDFAGAYFEELQKFRAQEFGEDVIIPLERTREYQANNINFYWAYGIFSSERVEIKALTQAFLISEVEYELMREGKRDERELKSWSPADGPAVLWIASVVSTTPGGATKVINALIGDLETHPYTSHIKTVAAFVTGAKGYMFAEACGMKPRSEVYEGRLPFFDGAFSRELLANASNMLSRTWNINEIKVSIERLRELTNGSMPLRVMDNHFAFGEEK